MPDMMPGRTAYRLAERVCTTRTMERLVDPIFADIQKEYGDAERHGRSYRARWILLTGYCYLLKAMASYACQQRGTLVRIAGRSVAIAFVSILALRGALGLLPFHLDPSPLGVSRSSYLLARCAQLGIGIGLTFGIFDALAVASVSRRMIAGIAAVALGCSLLSFMAPTQIPLGFSGVYGLFTGLGEERYRAMTRDERRQLMEVSPYPNHSVTISTTVAVYTRESISSAPLVLAAFALSVFGRRRLSRYQSFVAAFGSCVSYFLVMHLALSQFILKSFDDAWVQAQFVAWLPNAAFVLMTIMMIGNGKKSRLGIMGPDERHDPIMKDVGAGR